MKPKYKVTGCARFFIFFLFFVPAVFFGAAYLRGENGVQILKNLIHQITGQGASTTTPASDPQDEMSAEETIRRLEQELTQAKREIRDLKARLDMQEDELKKLRSGNQ